jgi:hypothetical protein
MKRKLRRRFRQNADDRIRRAVQQQRLTEDVRVAVEALLPEPMVDEYDRLAARTILLVRKIAPEDRFHAERRHQ